jgi:hypothetical protein
MDEGLQRAYFAILSGELNTEQFQDAVAETMKQERFWPSPGVILQHAKVASETKMLALPERCDQCGGGLGYAPGSGKRYLQHDESCPARKNATA